VKRCENSNDVFLMWLALAQPLWPRAKQGWGQGPAKGRLALKGQCKAPESLRLDLSNSGSDGVRLGTVMASLAVFAIREPA